MAKTPNYNFERKERDRIKAEKKARRAVEKKAARENNPESLDPSEQSDTEDEIVTKTE
ncbi:MAG: hypothetical protein JKY12_06530 [Sneathiella sp.]|nr:hypothetical protein [Sneathiella sp.]